ncbi:MAG TPA: MoaD/ThiS family protein [Candidatus Methylacidiphilales bacterium]|nr:MoaD/ThiS family protein [Candidatus Methylacidiphilales bacterium]
MKILFFAQTRLAAGCEECLLQLDRAITQDEFWDRLGQEHPALLSHRKTARLARGESYLQPDELLHPHDEIAIIPPVSGG